MITSAHLEAVDANQQTIWPENPRTTEPVCRASLIGVNLADRRRSYNAIKRSAPLAPFGAAQHSSTSA
jgi:hypothetical protein